MILTLQIILSVPVLVVAGLIITETAKRLRYRRAFYRAKSMRVDTERQEMCANDLISEDFLYRRDGWPFATWEDSRSPKSKPPHEAG